MRGVQTCGSVWVCPVCSSVVSAHRSEELRKAQGMWCDEEGGFTSHVTLTARHQRGDDLEWWLSRFLRAERRMKQSRTWKRLQACGMIGSVRSLETTFGGNGWHPHSHTILFWESRGREEALLLQLVEGLRLEWERCLLACGLECTEVGFLAEGSWSAAQYIAKHGRERDGWDTAAEMTGGVHKQGGRGGRTPFELLDDPSARPLFQAYAKAFKGKRQLTWSKGLKARFGLSEKTDEELASQGEASPETPVVSVAMLTWQQWLCVRSARAVPWMLDAAEQYGAPGVWRVVELCVLAWWDRLFASSA